MFSSPTSYSPPVGRLAPTPSGKLHLGNVTAFAAAWLSVRSRGGTLLLRMEDIDTTRARLDVEDAIRFDLEWLGLTWDHETPRQSAREYAQALDHLRDRVYTCLCTRAQRKAYGGHPHECRDARKPAASDGALRFWLEPATVNITDRRHGVRTVQMADFDDPVVRRRDGLFTYNLAVVVDDIRDGVTEVVRGSDLLDFSAVQEALWRAFGRVPPTWLHAPLILGGDGRKLSKSHGSAHIGAIREAGGTPEDVWARVFPWLGLPQEVRSLREAARVFDPAQGPLGPIALTETPEPASTQVITR